MSAETAADPARLDAASLEQTLRAVEPAVTLVPPRLLRRIIKQDRGILTPGLHVPHRKGYVITRGRLRRLADETELALGPDTGGSNRLILLPRPDDDQLAAAPREAILLKYWRLLFHACVHAELDRRFTEQPPTAAEMAARAGALGAVEFAEASAVLGEDRFLLPPADAAARYAEWAAVYLELSFFAPALLPAYFPSVRDFRALDRVFARDVSAAGVFARTRPPGAPDPLAVADPGLERPEEEDGEPPAAPPPADADRRPLFRRAKKALQVGNLVRAALLKVRAAHSGPYAARHEIDRLMRRLQAAVGFGDAEARRWRLALPALLERAAQGLWPVEARLLYDLQKACTDHEREVYAVDLVEWAYTLGRRPVRRHLPFEREVRMTRHLQSAARRLASARLGDRDRAALALLLQDAVHQSEEQLRAALRPAVQGVLDEVGMRAAHYAEQVARRKLIEELLDRVAGRGFLTLGDLRDAVSRNNLKLPDLKHPAEFLGGDRIIRANRRLAVALDGVYRRGEIYLRWLQRLSSVAFGTRVGRWIIRYFVLPFGGAYVALEGLQHLLHLVGLHKKLATPASVLLLGAFLLSVIHVPAFRHALLHALGLVYRVARALFVGLPAYLLGLPPIRAVWDSLPVAYFWRHLLKPALSAAAAYPLVS